MDNKLISSRQLAFLIFLLIPGSSLVFVPGITAAQDAWISTLLAAGVGLYVLYAIIKLHDIFPGQKISTVSTSVLGKIPGTILNLFFLWSIFLFLLALLFDLNMVLEIIYPFLPDTFSYALVILTSAYCVYKGLIALGRLGELFIGPSLLLMLAGLLLFLPLIDLPNLQPVLSNWKPVVAGTLYVADWPFNQIVIFGLFLPLVTDLSKNKPKLYWWYLAGGLALTLFTMLTIAALGVELVDIYQFPIYEVFRLAGFEDFQRIELGFFLLWFITAITCIIIYYQGLSLLIQDIFSLQHYKPLILPLGLCLLVFAIYMFPNTVEYQWLGFKDVTVYTLPINFLYPTILLIAAKIKQKRLHGETFPITSRQAK